MDENGKEITETDAQCEARTAGAVRALARGGLGDWPTWQAVWIADQPDAPKFEDSMLTNSN